MEAEGDAERKARQRAASRNERPPLFQVVFLAGDNLLSDQRYLL